MLQDSFNFGMGWSPENERAEHRERLFFAVFPDTDIGFRIDRARRKFCSENHIEGTLRGRKRLHISLHSVGDHTHLPSRIIYAAKLAGQAVSMPPFDVTLHSIMSFVRRPGERRPLVLRAEGIGLLEFHRTLGNAMNEIGLRTRKHFTPHVTVLYGPNAVPKQAIEPIGFVVREFFFIHSEVGRSKYNVLGRWSLQV